MKNLFVLVGVFAFWGAVWSLFSPTARFAMLLAVPCSGISVYILNKILGTSFGLPSSEAKKPRWMLEDEESEDSRR
jgi:hypothetical protein